MSFLRFTFLFICASLFSFSSHSFANQRQFEGSMVGDVDILVQHLPEGADFDKGKALAIMKTRAGNTFSQQIFDQDLKALAEEYDRVKPSLKIINNTVFIELTITLKPLIREIRWEGNEHLKSKKLKSELAVALETEFDRAAFNKSFDKLKAFYVKKGYFEAELDYKTVFLSDTNEVDIVIVVDEGRSGVIKDIVLEGFDEDMEHEVLKVLMTKEYSWYSSWITGDGTYRQEMIDHDKTMVLNMLQNHGYADAKVDLRVEEIPGKDRIRLIFSAQKGRIYSIRSLSFEGNQLFTSDEVREHFDMRNGDPYSPEKIREGIQSLTDAYGKLGYIESYISFKPTLNKSEAVYDVACEIREGKQFKVGMIKIFGNHSTKSRVILHEILLTPGAVFNMLKLKGSEERLKRIGYFKNVNVYAIKPQKESVLGDDFRDVNIEVEEKNTGTFSFSFGFSTLESAFIALELTENNFDSLGLTQVYKDGLGAARGNGEFQRVRASIGRKRQAYLISWAMPYFKDSDWVVGYDIEKSSSRLQSKDYEVESLGFGLNASYQINDFVRFRWDYRLRDVDVKVNKDASELLKTEAENNGVISATGVSLIYDSTDDPYKPRDGFRSEANAEIAGLGGDFTFGSLSYLNSLYRPLSSRGVFKSRLDMRAIKPFGKTSALDLPIGERLFLGGERSVRGFRGFSLGPKYPNGDPRGGITSLNASMEYLHKLTDRLDGFVFCDAGNVSLNLVRASNLKISYGFGLRFEIFPKMPIILGMGYPVNADSRNEIKRFFLSLGGTF
ncbi:Uncharacterized protein SCG7109_AC_00160 [Chlamydiales bacterium SCGC AG-110-M15]|nr:Uncharacterized protein SCG7109_AC_00160 [Chlamydiales bacterium SCGC AG-110-M15]